MKVYRRHNCLGNHRTYNAFTRCAIKRVEWVAGEGRFAVIAWCQVPTVTLHNNATAARNAKEFIDATACGGNCVRNHEVVEVSK